MGQGRPLAGADLQSETKAVRRVGERAPGARLKVTLGSGQSTPGEQALSPQHQVSGNWVTATLEECESPASRGLEVTGLYLGGNRAIKEIKQGDHIIRFSHKEDRFSCSVGNRMEGRRERYQGNDLGPF